MPGLYYSVWDSSIQWTEGNYIRPALMMVFSKLHCSVLASKNVCCGCSWDFSIMFKKNFQETIMVPVHAVPRGNHKAIRNEDFHRCFSKVQKINSFKDYFFALYALNADPVERTGISLISSAYR